MHVRNLLHQWSHRLAGRLLPWLIVAVLVAIADCFAPVTWGLATLQVVICLVAVQTLSRRQVPQLLVALMVLTILPYLMRPPYVLEPLRAWALLALLAAAVSHTASQRRRQRRLQIRQQLQRRVRRRALQIRRINDALRREITRRQATQQRLTRAETHLQSLAQRMQLQVIRKDVDGVITYANEAFCRGLGRSIDEVIGATDMDLYPPVLADAYRLDDERVMQSGQPVDHIESHPTADGQTGWVQVFKAPEYDDNNHVIGIQIVFWDVTDSYRKTAELRRSEARKRALFDAAREAVLLVDDEGVVVEANPAAEAMLASGGGPLAGQNLDHIAVPDASLIMLGEALTGEAPSASPSGLEPSVGTGGRQSLEWSDLPYGERREILLRPVARPKFPAEVSIHPIPLENSFGLAIFIRDVTLRHQALEALQEAKGAAEEASRIKSEFMASVSHEIRTPLGGITGSAELLCQMDLPPKARQYVEMIRHSGELLSNVIGDILDFAAIEAGRLHIAPEPTDLHRCVGEAFRSLATRALGKDLELVLSIMPEVPRTIVIDPNRLRQIIINLAGNAIKFTPAGYVLLRIGIETGDIAGIDPPPEEAASDGERRYLRIEMIDSGIGISEKRLAKIFEPFEQGETGTTRQYGGTGLGLSISDKLVRRMGGTIQVISRTGHGSTFRCFIPLNEVPSAANSSTLTEQHPAQGIALKIRHPVQRKAIGDLLLANGFRIDPKSKVRIIDQCFAKPRVPGQRSRGGKTIWIARVDEPTLPDQDPRQPVLLKPILPDDLLQLLRSDRSTAISPVSTAWRPVINGGLRPTAETPRTAPETEPNQPSPTLLLVDDSPVNQAVIRDFLVGAGYQVDLAGCGQEAVLATQLRSYACVLMDLQMPGMDGIEAMQQIVRHYHERQQIPPPFIALTAHATQEHRERCLAEGMKAFLVKPIDRKVLVKTVATWIASPIPSTVTPAVPEVPGTVASATIAAGGADSTESAWGATAPGEFLGEKPSGVEPDTSGAELTATDPAADASPSASSVPSDESSSDWQAKLWRTAGGDPATVGALVEAFLTEVPQLCEDLRTAVQAQDAALARRTAHTLKSCLKYIAPEEDWQRPWQVETAAVQNDLPTVEQLAPAAIETAERWVQRLEAHRAEA